LIGSARKKGSGGGEEAGGQSCNQQPLVGGGFKSLITPVAGKSLGRTIPHCRSNRGWSRHEPTVSVPGQDGGARLENPGTGPVCSPPPEEAGDLIHQHSLGFFLTVQNPHAFIFFALKGKKTSKSNK